MSGKVQRDGDRWEEKGERDRVGKSRKLPHHIAVPLKGAGELDEISCFSLPTRYSQTVNPCLGYRTFCLIPVEGTRVGTTEEYKLSDAIHSV